MKVNLRKPTALLAAAAIAASAVPMFAASASAADVGKTWKFDFGPEGQAVADGYYGVTPSTEYNSTSADGIQYGLYGQNENDYKLGNYEDGVTVKQGQVVSYAGEGSGSSADADRIGIGTLNASQIPGTYPVRFSMDAENNGYYEVKVNVTTLDSSSPATGVFVYSERRHPIVTNQTIAAGQTQTVTFRATVQSVLLKDRTNGGQITYADKKLNVSVMGTNAAISSIEVKKIDPSTTKTIWCYNDSTGCDYPMALPYFPMQNYGGTAQYLSKYLPENIALVNQGDGGLASGASSYFNVCKNNFKAGDYVYLQYGHNESSVAGYLKNLPTYYKFVHSKGANMVYAGPIDRHNASQYNASTNTWSSTLDGYSRAAKAYTEVLICAGPDAGDTFVSKAQTSVDEAYAYADGIIAAGITDAGVTDVAFVDLNAPTLEWLGEICTEVKNIKGSDSYDRAFSDYYFRADKTSSVDGTHENDYGADATASFFFDGIKAKENSNSAIEQVEYSVLSPLITNMRADYGSWDHVSADVINAGAAPNSAWPDVFKSSNVAAYPTSVKSITWNSDGTVNAVTIVNQESNMSMDDYGMLKLDIYDSNNDLKGTIGSTQVDNTWGAGTTTVYTANGDTSILTGDTSTVYDRSAGDTFTATIYRASKGDGADLNYITPLEAYSETYVYTDYEGTLITNEDGGAGEDFNFYGAKFDGTSSAADKNGWKLNGSATRSATLKQDTDRCYATVSFDDTENGSKSMNFCKKFADTPEVKSHGVLKMSVDLKNADNSNTGGLQFTLASNYSGNYPQGETLNLFGVYGNKVYVNGNSNYDAGDVSGNSWTTIKADADLDRGTITVKVGDNAAVTAPVSGLQKNMGASPTALNGLCIAKASLTNKAKCSASVDVSKLSIDKYSAADDLPSKTLTIVAAGGAVFANGVETTSVSAPQSSSVSLKAVPADFYSFTNWTDAEGNELSTEATYTYPRLYEDAEINANFTSIYGEGYEVSYVNGFKDDFEGETNIFGSTDLFDTTTLDASSVFGNVMRVSGSNDLTAALDEAIALGSKQYLDLSFNAFYSYLSNGKDTKFSVVDNSGNELVSYTYNFGSSSVTDVSIGGVTVDGFAAFGFSSGTRGFENNTNRYSFISSANAGLVSIRINGDKTVSISFANKATQTFAGTLSSPVTIKSMKITNGNTSNAARTAGFDNFDAMLVTVPAERYPYTINAVDENDNVIKTFTTGSASAGDEITQVVTAYIKDDNGSFYSLDDSSVTGYVKSITKTAEEETINIRYRTNNAVVYYAEAEDLQNANASDEAGYSGGRKSFMTAEKNVVDRFPKISDIPAGSYKVTIGGIANNDGKNRNIFIRKAEASHAAEYIYASTAELGTKSFDITLDEPTTLVITGYDDSSNAARAYLSNNFDYIVFEAKPTVTMSDRFTSTDAGSEKAMAYVAQFTQNDYGASSAKWYVSHAEDANKYMEQNVEFPGMSTGTTVQLGLMLIGNIDEVGNVTFTID